jgi:glycosyltransferase involved in cell wall biosynthesis
MLKGRRAGDPGPAVTILMCTYNGARFLGEQLESIERQSYRTWRVVACDDGSTDMTLPMLAKFQTRAACGCVDIRQGGGKGYVHNYLKLACDNAIGGDFFAFCDQDDVWEPNKLERALAWLTEVPSAVPALYCSRTKHIDASGREIGRSRGFTGHPTFANALVQSIAGGNTMVFNEATRRLIRVVGVVDAPAHDWLLYLLVTATEGAVKYDAYPTIRYRLHPGNAIGNPGWLRRVKMLRDNQFRMLTGKNLSILMSFWPHITDRNKVILDEFSKLRQRHIFGRVAAFFRSGVHRKSLSGNMGLLLAVVLGKL